MAELAGTVVGEFCTDMRAVCPACVLFSVLLAKYESSLVFLQTAACIDDALLSTVASGLLKHLMTKVFGGDTDNFPMSGI